MKLVVVHYRGKECQVKIEQVRTPAMCNTQHLILQNHKLDLVVVETYLVQDHIVNQKGRDIEDQVKVNHQLV
ncbi:MAG: hypothetical protein CL489_11735 [Acidobacteria bacterium]|nr:hypothetical protein [Acidobacteriota bacterium]